MGRKRLMTFLATIVAVIGLQAAPAAAQELDLPGASIDLEEGLDVDLDVQVTDDLKVDPEIDLDLDGEPDLDVDGGVKAGDAEVDLGEVTEPSPSPSPEAPDPQPSEDADDAADEDADDAAAGDSDGDETSDHRSADRVMASGGAFDWSPDRRAQFEAFRALRSRDFGFGTASTSVMPGVELAPRRAGVPEDEVGMLEYDQPLVAPGVAVASEPVGGDDTFAATPATQPTDDVPVPLQVLTAMLVAGAALAWNLTRRELSWAFSGLGRR
ncbi:MAG: hypothetical protein WD378_03515 [Egicoccus sp.]